MPPYDPTAYPERPQQPDGVGAALKIGATLIGVGLGIGAYRALRQSTAGAFADARYMLEPLSMKLGRLGHNFRESLSSLSSTRTFSRGLLPEISRQYTQFMSTPDSVRQQLQRNLKKAIKRRFSRPEGLHTNLPEGYEYLNVEHVVSEYERVGAGAAKPIGGGRETVTIFGREMDELDLIAMKQMRRKADPLLTGEEIIDRGVFLNRKEGVITEAFTAGSIQKALTERLRYPFVGNPLDFIFSGEGPLTARLSAKNMAMLGFEPEQGFIIDDELFSIREGELQKLGSGYKIYATDSSAARGIASMDERYASTKPLRGYKDAATGRTRKGLIEKGFYDHPILEAIFNKKIGGGPSLNELIEGATGRRLNFVYNADTGATPLTASVDEWLTSKGLDVYSSRHAVEPKTVYGKIFDWFKRFGKTTPHPKYSGAEGIVWHPKRGFVKGEDQLDLFERIANKLGIETSQYAHLTEEELILARTQKGRISMERLRRLRRVQSGREASPFGKVDPSPKQRRQNAFRGLKPSSPVSAQYMAYEGGFMNSLKIKAAQGSQTTVRLIEALTGLGVKPMGPMQFLGAAALTGVGAYLAWEGLHFFDYLVEKANPFGDVGLKKSALATYGTLKVGQQAITNYTMTPVAEGVDAVFPGLPDSFLGYAFRGLAGIAVGGAIGKRLASKRAANRGILSDIGQATAKTRGGMVGAVVGGLALGTSATMKDWRDLRAEYMGEKLVPIRENRWWGLGPQDYAGGDITRMRKHYIARQMEDQPYDIYGGKGAYFLNVSPLTLPLRTPLTSWTGLPGTDPYYTERRNYYNQPYPLTGQLFTDVPIIGPLLGATIGEGLKPTKIMHGHAIRDFIQKRGKKDELQQIASELGYETINPGFTVPRVPSLLDAAGQTLDRIKTFWGMRGFIIGFAKKQLTGTSDFFAEGRRWQNATDLYSTSRAYYDMDLGGAIGSTELLRRFLPGMRTRDEINPMVSNFHNGYNASGGFQVFPGSPFMGGQGQPSTLIKTDHSAAFSVNPSTSWTMGLKPSLPHIPYAFSKLYQRQTPLDLYRDRITVGDDFYDWTQPIDSMLIPYMRQMASRDVIDSATSGAAFAVLGRDPYSAMVLGIGGMGAGVVSNLLNTGDHWEKEQRRREIETYFDSMKAQKVEVLSDIAQRAGRNDVVARLDKIHGRTMRGLDYGSANQEFIENAYLALPKADRRFLLDFSHAPSEYHEDILREVPDYMAPMLQKIWQARGGSLGANMQALQQSQASVAGTPMPGPGWAGWRPDVSLDDIKLASVQFDGRDVHDYGFWGADERDLDRSRPYIKNLITLPNMATIGDEMIAASYSMPINNMQISSMPTVGAVGDNHANIDIMYDRRSTFDAYKYRYSGRF